MEEVKEVLLGFLVGAASPEDVYRTVSGLDYSESGGVTREERSDLGLLELISLEICEGYRGEEELLLVVSDWLRKSMSAPDWIFGVPEVGRSSSENVSSAWNLELPTASELGVAFPMDWVDEARPILHNGAETQLINR